ncbi:MAG: hypothetical protein PUP93_18755 [Rhizonema sp. NSF051]|nr:hypothetical protein [Rhizonema sp. NSF051]
MKKLQPELVLAPPSSPMTRADYIDIIDVLETAIEKIVLEAKSKGITLTKCN